MIKQFIFIVSDHSAENNLSLIQLSKLIVRIK
jgi:hypothetical protein